MLFSCRNTLLLFLQQISKSKFATKFQIFQFFFAVTLMSLINLTCPLDNDALCNRVSNLDNRGVKTQDLAGIEQGVLPSGNMFQTSNTTTELLPEGSTYTEDL